MKRLLLLLLALMTCTFSGCGDDTSGGVAVDTTAPTVSAFSLPASSNSLSVPVTSLEASDSGAPCAGYLITETATPPLAGDPGWSATKPTQFTFSSAGAVSAYAWAKDAAGNVSLAATASVTITLPTKAVLKLSTVGAATSLSGVGITVTLPAGVTVATVEGTVADGVAAVSGVALPGSLAPVVYQPATETANATVRLVVASSAAQGFGIGEFATLTCDLAPGSVPAAAAFTWSALNPGDLLLQPVEGLTATLQVEFQ